VLPAITETLTIRTTASEADAREIVRRVAVGERRGRSEPQSDSWDVVKLGSRWEFRMFGMWGPLIDRRLPIELRTKVGTEDGSTVVSLLFSNDEGPYLFRLPTVERLFPATYQLIASEIRSLLPDAS
jgi:hypothetical protein